MMAKEIKQQTKQTQLIAIVSLVFSIFAIILTVYTVLNINNALQGYAKWPAWPNQILPGIGRGLINQPSLPPSVPSILPRATWPVTTIPVLPTSALIPTALPQSYIASILSAGNGAPSGTHYNLNLIGVPKGKAASLTGNEGHRIFVPLTGNCQIALGQGDFQVVDGNCTDGQAIFQLPNPDPTNSGITVYSVWARALGKPGGSSSATTCATDNATGDLYCSVYSTLSLRNTGFSKFSNVSRELLYVYADLNGDKKLERVPLFDSRLQDYYWQYDNQGLKLVQLRFYEITTRVP